MIGAAARLVNYVTACATARPLESNVIVDANSVTMVYRGVLHGLTQQQTIISKT